MKLCHLSVVFWSPYYAFVISFLAQDLAFLSWLASYTLLSLPLKARWHQIFNSTDTLYLNDVSPSVLLKNRLPQTIGLVNKARQFLMLQDFGTLIRQYDCDPLRVGQIGIIAFPKPILPKACLFFFFFKKRLLCISGSKEYTLKKAMDRPIGGLNQPQDCDHTQSNVLNVVSILESSSFETHTHLTQMPEVFSMSCFLTIFKSLLLQNI